MNRRFAIITICCGGIFALTACVVAARAQGGAPAAVSTAPRSGFRAEFLTELTVVQGRLLRLAEAMPAEKFTWRPGEGVRSVSEVFLHVAAANYNLPGEWSATPPVGVVKRGLEKSTTEKSEVIKIMQDSFVYLRSTIASMSDADAEKKVAWFGGENTYRGLLLFTIRHMAEHLGQSIAYARMNGVVPPWTTDFEKETKKDPPKKP